MDGTRKAVGVGILVVFLGCAITSFLCKQESACQTAAVYGLAGSVLALSVFSVANLLALLFCFPGPQPSTDPAVMPQEDEIPHEVEV